jgi:hypothetical protein
MSLTNPSARRAFNTFDVQPSAPPPAGVIDFDELMIDWGEIPVGSVATIYWPAVSAAQVLKLADARYAFHTLGTADAHTVQCLTTRRLSYVPIPANAGPKFAGLISIEMPSSIAAGQTYKATVRRVTTYTPPPPFVPGPIQSPSINAHLGTAPVRASRGASSRSPTVLPGAAGTTGGTPTNRKVTMTSWRTVSGAFQINVPVQTATELLPFAENTLAIFKWRLSVMPTANRWRPVLIRYIDYLSQQIDADGGNASAILPSQTGLPHKPRPGKIQDCAGEPKGMLPPKDCVCLQGKIIGIVYDCFGDFEGFSLGCCDGERSIKASERRIEELVLRALEERCRVEAFVSEASGKLIQLVVRG